MPLNIVKGNMYGFITHTWNFIKGICPHNCSYCYMYKRWPRMRKLRLDEKEFKIRPEPGSKIFIGSSIDMFADAIPSEWINKILWCIDTMKDCTFLLQTKNPKRFNHNRYPDNCILCCTIETNRNCITSNEPKIIDRIYYFTHGMPDNKRMLTIEPIMDFDVTEMLNLIIQSNPIQINIGADSGNNHLSEPSKEKLETFIRLLKDINFNVFLKSNLKRILNGQYNKIIGKVQYKNKNI